MSKWVSTPAVITVEFDGDEVVAELDRLKVPDMAVMVGKKIDLTTTEGQMQVCELGSTIIPKYLRSLRGLTDGEGQVIDAERFKTLLDEFYFAPLVANLLLKLIGESSVKEREKN